MFMGILTLSQLSSQTMLHHAIAFIEGLNSVVMIYITLVAQLGGGPRECHNQINEPINGSNRKHTKTLSHLQCMNKYMMF